MPHKEKIADVCIIVEGTYPFVKGGVSSWVHQIVQNYKDLNFEIISITPSDKVTIKSKYEVPKNVKKIHVLPLRKTIKVPLFSRKKMKHIHYFKDFFNKFFDYKEFENLSKNIKNLSEKDKHNLLLESIYSEEVFDFINEFYTNNKKFNTKPYIDFFWSLRSIYYSFLNIFVYSLPKAKVYHTISTGYAGLVASLCKIQNPNSRLLLTEHGIYTRERKMDITISDWADRNHDEYNPKNSISVYKDMWEDTFSLISKITYEYCDEILSLNKKNNLIQINEGASEDKVYFVRNGVNLKRFEYKERKEINKEDYKIGFLGRVVKIKDVKTFIKAADIVLKEYPNGKFFIAGPTDEDEDYYETCKDLIEVLKLKEKVIFTGLVKPEEFLQEIDLMILTSLSEAQPLVIAEANACGVPCIATDVGGCAEMILGGAEDRSGKSGLITKSVNPLQTAEAILSLIKSPNLYNQFSINGRQRAINFYDENTFLLKYKKIYTENIKLSESNYGK